MKTVIYVIYVLCDWVLLERKEDVCEDAIQNMCIWDWTTHSSFMKRWYTILLPL